MTLIKVDPFRSVDTMLRRMTDVFDDVQRTGVRFEIGDFTPRVDIAETDTAVSFHIELPGLTKENVTVAINDGNVLTIRGDKKREEKTEAKNFIRVERSFGSFTRSFTLPDGLDPATVAATFENGVLDVSISKKVPAAPKEQLVSIQ